MAGSGNKRVVYNTRERLLSTDHNREQAFEGADIAEALARMFLPVYEDDAGVSTLDETKGTPPTALILDGLMFRPIDGSVNALVDAGSVVMSDPDLVPSADDVPWKWVHSDGVTVAGTLALTPNPGGIRIDVVEFSRTEEVVEFDSRDQFDPGTGFFTPVPLEKVRRGALVFRIRLGVVGSSFPGVVQGWVPIAVCRVPAVAVDWDVVTIWDVRPLLADRRAGAANVQHLLPHINRANVAITGIQHRGVIDAELLGWRIGGKLDTSSPGVQPGYVDVGAAANQEGSGLIVAGKRCWYLYLLFPYGLPGWRRYSDPGVGGRVPNAQRGLATASVTPPRYLGTPSSTIFPSNATSLQNGTYAAGSHPALCVISGRVSSGPGEVPLGSLCDGRMQHPAEDDGASAIAATAIGATEAMYSIAPDLEFPDNARAVRAVIRASFSSTASILFGIPTLVQITEAGTLTTVLFEGATSGLLRIENGQSVDFAFTTRLPLAASLNTGVARSAFEVKWTYGALPVGLSITASTIQVTGWEIGP